MRVNYIPVTIHQTIYKCLSVVSKAVHEVLTSGYYRARGECGDGVRLSTILSNFNTKLITAGLLLSLFKEVYGKTNDESF